MINRQIIFHKEMNKSPVQRSDDRISSGDIDTLCIPSLILSSVGVQVAYAIGVAEPLSIFISSYGTGIKSDAELLKIVKHNFDLRPGKIVK